MWSIQRPGRYTSSVQGWHDGGLGTMPPSPACPDVVLLFGMRFNIYTQTCPAKMSSVSQCLQVIFKPCPLYSFSWKLPHFCVNLQLENIQSAEGMICFLFSFCFASCFRMPTRKMNFSNRACVRE